MYINTTINYTLVVKKDILRLTSCFSNLLDVKLNSKQCKAMFFWFKNDATEGIVKSLILTYI
jgi:hypothetical protein